jgi:hypothetical protein
MAVTEQTPIQAYTASGSSAVFAYSFQVLAAGDMAATINGEAIASSAYTVAGAGSPSGGTVTFATTPAAGARVVLYRDSALTRSTDYQNNGDLLAAVVNRDFDRLWLVLQEINSGSKAPVSAVRAAAGETLDVLPGAAARANKILSFDASGQPIASAPVAGTATALALDLAASGGAAMIGYGDRTLEEYLEETLDVFRFMTEAQIADVRSASPALDHTAAIQEAINDAQLLSGERRLRINGTQAGYYRITAPLVVNGNFLTIEWDSTNAVIKKFFNGDMFQINGGEVEFHRCALDGNGASFTGGGVRLLSTAANSFRMVNPRIKETAAAPLLIEANAGSLMKVIGGLLQPYNASAAGPVHAVAMTGADSGPMNRKLIGVSTGGAPIMDASGAETVQIIGCDGSGVTTSALSKKVSVTGSRLQTGGGNVVISGIDHCFVGNTCASSFELASGAANCVVKENVTVGQECIDSSGNARNKAVFFGSSFTPSWTASGTNPAIGNGSLVGRFDRHDRIVTVTVDLLAGSTTTFGAGEYSFALPLPAVAARDSIGSAWFLDAGTAFYSGVVLVAGGSSSAQVYFNNTASSMSASVPVTMASGDRLRFQIQYQAAES